MKKVLDFLFLGIIFYSGLKKGEEEMKNYFFVAITFLIGLCLADFSTVSVFRFGTTLRDDCNSAVAFNGSYYVGTNQLDNLYKVTGTEIIPYSLNSGDIITYLAVDSVRNQIVITYKNRKVSLYNPETEEEIWLRQVPGAVACSTTVVTDSGYLCAGSKTVAPSPTAFIAMLNPETGDTLWYKGFNNLVCIKYGIPQGNGYFFIGLDTSIPPKLCSFHTDYWGNLVGSFVLYTVESPYITGLYREGNACTFYGQCNLKPYFLRIPTDTDMPYGTVYHYIDTTSSMTIIPTCINRIGSVLYIATYCIASGGVYKIDLYTLSSFFTDFSAVYNSSYAIRSSCYLMDETPDGVTFVGSVQGSSTLFGTPVGNVDLFCMYTTIPELSVSETLDTTDITQEPIISTAIFDIRGKYIGSSSDGLSTGMYFSRFTTASNRTYTKKVVIVK